MYSYNLDTKKAKEATSKRINTKGAYTGHFTLVFGKKASTGAVGIEFNFMCSDGLEANYLTLWTHNKFGEEIFGVNMIHAMMTCMKVKKMQSNAIQVMRYDPVAKCEVPEELDVFEMLMNKPIGVILFVEEYKNKDGKIKEKMAIYGFFNPETKQMASEILDKEEPTRLEKILLSLKNKRFEEKVPIKEESTSEDHFDDDIPF